MLTFCFNFQEPGSGGGGFMSPGFGGSQTPGADVKVCSNYGIITELVNL